MSSAATVRVHIFIVIAFFFFPSVELSRSMSSSLGHDLIIFTLLDLRVVAEASRQTKGAYSRNRLSDNPVLHLYLPAVGIDASRLESGAYICDDAVARPATRGPTQRSRYT